MSVVSGGPSEASGVRAGTRQTTILLGMDMDGLEYLRSGGDLVTAIDDKPVTTFDDLLVYLESHKLPGERVRLTVIRSGDEERAITVVLGQRPRRAPQ
jgi:S1-C subfamily serine protease